MSEHPNSSELGALTTEQPNPASEGLDVLSVQEMLRVINEEDKLVPLAVEREIPRIAQAIDLVVDRLRQGGRLFYVGAGTSGRLGVVDASECPPTFGTDPELVQGLIAGGPAAVFQSQEGAEDHPEEAVRELQSRGLSAQDAIVALSASGRTPFCIGALQYARSVGAAAIALVCNENAEMSRFAEVTLCPVVGPEVVTGSTRMKAGTAEKLVLNMISTVTMVRLGRVKGNLMVDMQLRCGKLWERATRLVQRLTGVSADEARAALEQHEGSVRLAAEALKRRSELG
ncbi:MAG: N-acetylmuramic acid 6-phosphate etherase [Armatimonadetes bacterium CG_4_10_14_3_um_filter_66_18]|nr:N-acetylmuramic acid 6-phosphate etherase [Armatimonadota bacterium]OIP01889.1 MAG: N-acetylmuramic acid 6-phosphate etherase [Armatimonadetes bacterium CG2_30_66_41]PIU91062.1 MAG: N-acetylmuramic acid 6-phosphate etherase [Armatimonadetes bacterium CG06_land_8_20_14_3_00_66_21]PIX42051.1 MAG: N-acetylmuramic acid 6-phosphate etherase [Armatimonadetes bacterium CG_4_8_14_3_um_filter_66_20]PIY41343.1 MAG: N-acetylmuramic acid 6-phosphate etherase [Armatimonadetes bacterium CG_4_10_14_3_um_fi